MSLFLKRRESGRGLLLAVTLPVSWGFYKGFLRYLHGSGFEVMMLSSPGPNFEATAEREGVPGIAVPMEREMSPIKDLISLWRLYRILRRTRPRITNASTPKAGLLVAIAAWFAGVPCRVYSLRGLRLETATGSKRSILWLAEWLACTLSCRVLCVSPSLRDRAVTLKLVPRNKTVVLEKGGCGVDVEHFAPKDRYSPEVRRLRDRLGIPDTAPVIGFVGRFVKDKGIRQLVEAFATLRLTYTDLHLILVGDFERGDPVELDVRRYIEDTAEIIRTGFVSDVAPYYALMDVLALPTYREGFGQVSVEAQASAVPVVTTMATGVIDSVLDGITGILVPVGDSHALASAMGALLADRDLRSKMGQAGREWMERDFRPATLWEAQASLYRELMCESR
jgi:glycosyltransferase involved in cell wall biosynthesis